MTRPTKHPRTGVYQVRVAIPKRLRAITKRAHGCGAEFTQSLHTKDPAEAKARAPEAVEKFSAWLKAAAAEHQGQSVHLTDREISALCGRWLAQQEAQQRDNLAGTAEDHEEAASYLGDALSALSTPENGMSDVARIAMATADALDATKESLGALLAAEGLRVDANSRQRLAVRLADVQWHWERDTAERLRSGRWEPSISSAEFSAGPLQRPNGASSQACTMDTLLAGWALDHGWHLDQKPIPRPLYDRLRTMERLAAFLRHRDASRVAKADAVRWKEDMQTRGLHPATVRNDLSEMSAIWKWGLRNGKLADDNPFAGISPPKPARKKREPRSFTDQEAAAILQAARKEHGFLRWLPWVLCLTGARLGEIVQSAKEDVTTIDGIPALRIHDEGEDRSLKNADSHRNVPLHPALIAEGFVDYVTTLPAGSPLFPDIKRDSLFHRRADTASKQFSRWIRKRHGITDPRISPAHSFRHWFIEACRRVVMPYEVHSAITGHSAKLDESAGYGRGMQTMTQVLAEWMQRVPCPARWASATTAVD